MSVEKPDYDDADIVLRIYEMRRETKTRQARDLLNFEFWPKSYDDVKAVQQADHPMNFAWRQLSGYWEMVFSMARNGIVNADFLTENNGEGLFFFAKIAPYLEDIRRDGSANAFKNVEWATTASKTGRNMFAYTQEVVKKRTDSQQT